VQIGLLQPGSDHSAVEASAAQFGGAEPIASERVKAEDTMGQRPAKTWPRK